MPQASNPHNVPHHTEAEAREAVPRWLAIIDADVSALHEAVRQEDWSEAHKQVVNVKWDTTNLAGRTLDLQHHTAKRPS